MSFNPNLPAHNTPLVSAEMRGQLNGLAAMIAAVPTITGVIIDGVTTLPSDQPATVTATMIGTVLHLSFGIPSGADGPPGSAFSQTVVDSVVTLNPGDNATAATSFDGTAVHFTFAIPRGNDGPQGIQGIQGIQGPPFAQMIVDSVTTLPAGSQATASVSFDGTNVHLTLGIPIGATGATGADGAPGEVTMAQLTAAIATAVSGTSNNTNAIATLDSPFADPDAESMRQRFNELVLALRR